MLRRQVATSSRVAVSCGSLVAKRFGGGDSSVEYDHSGAFARPLSGHESEILKAQKNRTVSGVVPGKVFMRHWISAEQATVSIYNRGLSVAVTIALILLGGVYATTNSWSTETALPLMGFVYFTYFMVVHTHMNSLYGVFFGAYCIALLLGY
jgi:uncharacterized membrane protein YozB (DUF420 family)